MNKRKTEPNPFGLDTSLSKLRETRNEGSGAGPDSAAIAAADRVYQQAPTPPPPATPIVDSAMPPPLATATAPRVVQANGPGARGSGRAVVARRSRVASTVVLHKRTTNLSDEDLDFMTDLKVECLTAARQSTSEAEILRAGIAALAKLGKTAAVDLITSLPRIKRGPKSTASDLTTDT